MSVIFESFHCLMAEIEAKKREVFSPHFRVNGNVVVGEHNANKINSKLAKVSSFIMFNKLVSQIEPIYRKDESIGAKKMIIKWFAILCRITKI